MVVLMRPAGWAEVLAKAKSEGGRGNGATVRVGGTAFADGLGRRKAPLPPRKAKAKILSKISGMLKCTPES